MPCDCSDNQQYGVLIIGLGKIGLQYDLTSLDNCFFTHTKAFHRHPGFDIIGGIDPLPDRCNEFEEATSKPARQSLENLTLTEKPAIIVISTQPENRLEIIQRCLALRPNLVLLEKPLALNVEEGSRILSLCREYRAELFVNYFRRCDPVVQQIKVDIQKNNFGAFLSGHVYYSGGVFTNASHLLDLILFWFDTSNKVVAIGGTPWPSRAGDIDLDFWLDLKGGRCVFQAIDKRAFDMAQIEIVFENAVIRYVDFGRRIFIYKVEQDPDFAEHRRLGYTPLYLSSEYQRCQYTVVDHIYKHLKYGDALVSTGETALESLRCCSQLK